MPTKIFKAAAVRVKAADTDTGTVEGYAATFGNVDSYGDTIAPGAFTKTLAAHNAEDRPIPVLFGHDSSNLAGYVGTITSATEDATGLAVQIQLDTDDDQAAKALRLVKSGRIGAMSIGFFAADAEPNPGGDGYLLKEIDLLEVSLVLAPADKHATITSVKSAMPGEREAVTKDDTAALAKSLHDGGLDGLRAALSTRNAEPDSEARYLDTLLEGDKEAAMKHGHQLTAEARARMENAAAAHLVKSAADSGRGLTEAENERLRTIQRLESIRANRREANAVIEQFKNLSFDHLDPLAGKYGDHSRKDHHTMTTKHLPLHPKARREVATRLTDEISAKSMAVEAGSAIAETGPTEVIAQLTEPKNLLAIVDQKIQPTPAFSWLRQTVRDLNAGRVAVGEVKPESSLGFTKESGELEVVAHVVKGIDEYILKDVADLVSFLSSEMVTGVLQALEAWTAEAIAEADGRAVQEHTVDGFTTARRAVTQLTANGLEPAAFVLHPDDWAGLETTKADGSGVFILNAAPVDRSNGTLWGVPVVTSSRITNGTAYLIAQDTVTIHGDGSMRLAWNASGEEFERNQVTIRAESRYLPTVRRDAGIVELALTDDNEDTEG